MRQTVCNKGLVALVLGAAVALLGAGCNAGSGDGAAGSGATTTAPPASTTTAPPPPDVLAVTYTHTETGDGSGDRPPPRHFHAEVSADGASFRMTADDGWQDWAFDAATGTSYEWNKAQSGAPESVRLSKGLATGGPDHHGLTDGPDAAIAVFVRALGRAGDSRVTTVTRHGRPAWHYDGPMVGDALAGPTIEDHVVVDVDQQSGVLLLHAVSAQGRETRRFEATSVEPRPHEDRRRYRPDPPPTAEVTVDDHGFSAMTLDEVAANAGYDLLVPASVPAGFELDEVLWDAEKPLYTGAEALNPAPARVTSMTWRGPAGARVTVTLRPENSDPGAKQEGQVWSDPFGGEGVNLPATEVSVPLEGRPPLVGEVFLAAPAVPHLWGITGDLVVTVDGDLDADGLRALARSLRRHPRPAASPAAPAKCPVIGFTPNSDDVAADITATGVDCAEATALVRRARERHDPVTGPRFFHLPPYICRAARQDTALESTAYRCDDGARRVTWSKT